MAQRESPVTEMGQISGAAARGVGRMSDDSRIDIVLAAYNGAAFIEAQIESLLAQTHRDWRLLIRDDGSTDATPAIIGALQQRYPEKISVIEDDRGNLGFVGNFSCLLEHATADYVAFCDQDDVWKPEKLAASLAEMHALEARHGAGTPLLVFTDTAVVDRSLKLLSDSAWHYQYMDPKSCGRLNRALIQNVVTGCTVLINAALKARAIPIPASAYAHDWWIALVASAFGAVSYVDKAMVYYRQHDEHAIGVRLFRLTSIPRLARDFLAQFAANRAQKLRRFAQGAAFLERFADLLTGEQRRLVGVFAAVPRANLPMRAYYFYRYGFLTKSFTRNALLILLSRQAP